LAQVQAAVRTRMLRAFASRGLIERIEAREMLAFKHSGFSVNAGVCIQALDRAAAWSGCCATARARRLHWSGCARTHRSELW
jgi:hypothetical protein